MDRHLVLRAQRGDEDAFAQIANASASRLHAVAYRILRDDPHAEDATQQALLDIWRRLPTLRDPDRFEAWSYRILVRICYAIAGQSRRWRARLVPWPQRDPVGPDGLRGIEERDLFDHVFARLSIEHRTVIVFHHYLGMTHEEIGQTLGIPPGTVKSRLSRAVERLRVLLGPEVAAIPIASKESVR
jgi:RNA polymerase sigma-70 factor, ECF subfamily